MHRDYSKAMEKYIELSIGTAPWPMGVTMVGIHEHSTTPKVAPSHVAHILNDETQRKYLQSIKRLITICQSRFSTESHKGAV
jgi:pre-mRNA-splicing factor 18